MSQNLKIVDQQLISCQNINFSCYFCNPQPILLAQIALFIKLFFQILQFFNFLLIKILGYSNTTQKFDIIRYLIYNSDMLPLSTKQMMQQSLPFKFSFAAAISLFITVGILGIVSTSAVCTWSRTYTSCYQASSYYNRQCYDYGTTYCCYTDSYSYCGNSYYCKPLSSFNYSQWIPCWGVLIAMWVCSVVCFILFIVVMVMFFNFRKRYREQFMMNSMNYANSSPIIYVNSVPPAYQVPINHSVGGLSEYNQGLIQ